MRDEIRVFLNENLAGRPEVELLRMIAEKFAMHARPNKPAVGVDVDLGHAEFRRRQVFVLVYPRADGSSFPPAALMRSTSSIGTLELPCMTMGVPGIRFWISSITLKCNPCLPLNL